MRTYSNPELTRAKMREARKHRGPVSAETRARMRESHLGQRRTPETRRKISLSKAMRTDPRLVATNSPTTHDIAWAAGIYEGEGSCGHTKTNSSQIRVSQNDPEIIRRLERFFGGSVHFDDRVSRGDAHAINGIWVWSLSGSRARGFILTIWPWLSERRRGQVARMLQNRHGFEVSS